jgi:hypothetical protein
MGPNPFHGSSESARYVRPVSAPSESTRSALPGGLRPRAATPARPSRPSVRVPTPLPGPVRVDPMCVSRRRSTPGGPLGASTPPFVPMTLRALSIGRRTGPLVAFGDPAASQCAPDFLCSPTPAPLQAVPADRAGCTAHPRVPRLDRLAPDSFRPLDSGPGRSPPGTSRDSCARLRCRAHSGAESPLRAVFGRYRAETPRIAFVVRDWAAMTPGARASESAGASPSPGRGDPAVGRGPSRLGVGWARALQYPRVSTPPLHLLWVSAPVSSPPPAPWPAYGPPSLPSRGPPLRARCGAATRIRQPASRVRCAAARFRAGAPTADLESCLRPMPTPLPLGAPIAVIAK